MHVQVAECPRAPFDAPENEHPNHREDDRRDEEDREFYLDRDERRDFEIDTIQLVI